MTGVQVVQSAHRWKRVEPGWYDLGGTNISVRNMKGQSVKNTGTFVQPWRIYVGTTEQLVQYWTLKEAKAAAWRMLP